MLILSVSQLNLQVKNYLEHKLGIINVEGEISNLIKPNSGHFYFTLKDKAAQIRCVFFKNRHGPFSTKLENGQQIIASGRLSLYEARGDYQLIVEMLTESGIGALYQQFEALKAKLAEEGLFLQSRKKILPHMPKTIGIITSPTGAAIQDILATLSMRFPLAQILIYSSEVQGIKASSQLIKALKAAHLDSRSEVLILARGGGSLEDLRAFNDELLAREIASSTIPIVSGVGHETDFTIADFVADFRAATPTAAAAAVTPHRMELLNNVNQALIRLQSAMEKILHHFTTKLNYLMSKIASPKQVIMAHWQTLDYLEKQLATYFYSQVQQKKQLLYLYNSRLQSQNPKLNLLLQQRRLNQNTHQLIQLIQLILTQCNSQLKTYLTTLNAVSPLATLVRGYAIATRENTILSSVQKIHIGDMIDLRLKDGHLSCEVTHKHSSSFKVTNND